MHPGFHWWKHAREARGGGGGECASACGPRGHRHEGAHEGWAGRSAGHDDFGGGGLGVRRPLRFLAHKLELEDAQVAELARILNELKTERAQAEVDDRRTLTAFADAVSAETFDAKRAAEGAQSRIASAERLRDAVTKALSEIHAILDKEQRAQLAYLIRTGTLTL
jgi:Spy/CpxP family protein refolding chaperone